MKNTIRLLAAPLVATALGAAGLAAHAAEAYPSKLVRIVVPSPPGGSNDVMARLLSLKLQELWKQSVIVEYKPGGAQIIGTDFVAKSPPDGYTIGIMLNSHLINANIRKDLPYDTLKDFSGVMLVGYQPLIITTASSGPYHSLADVYAAARKKPGSVSYATPGAGSPMHFTGEVMAKASGAELVHIPFKGGSQQQHEVVSGRVTLNIASLGTTLPHIESGKLRPLAVVEPKRLSGYPDIPALTETIAGFSAQSFIGLVVPKATPREVVRKINEGLQTVVKSPDFIAAMDKNAFTIVASQPEALDDYLRKEMKRWETLVRTTGIVIE